jgi:DNA-damage-inducible protein D
MSITKLKEIRQIPKDRSPLDFMGRREMAANLFRLEETRAKIENENISGQNKLEDAAFQVGRIVRQTMLDITGQKPEELPRAQDIKLGTKGIKAVNKDLKKIDKDRK